MEMRWNMVHMTVKIMDNIEKKEKGYVRFLRAGIYAVFGITLFITVPHIAHQQIDMPIISQSACVACDAPTGAFTDVVIRARGAYVYDVQDKKALFAHHAETQLPLASVTKAMTALIAYETIPKDASIEILSDFLSSEGDSGLLPHERFTRNDLIDLTLSVSSNDGARALAMKAGEYIAPNTSDAMQAFVSTMNTRAKTLGLTQTFFLNESGLDESLGTAGAYGSARDMALLFASILKTAPDLLEATTYPSVSVSSSLNLHTVKNTNIIAGKIPGLIGSKTGFTDLAGGNLVIVFEPEPLHPIIIAVLGSTTDDRFSDVDTLVSATMATFLRNK